MKAVSGNFFGEESKWLYANHDGALVLLNVVASCQQDNRDEWKEIFFHVIVI